jgi:5,10-methylene-tetrahydrofolate dehydrogenase/methenyl tetrahydrofolate cyclohydrolase
MIAVSRTANLLNIVILNYFASLIDMELQFDGQTAVVTGAGSELGKACAVFLASRGANIVVNEENDSRVSVPPPDICGQD